MIPLKDDIESSSPPVVTVFIILFNLLFFVYQLGQPEAFTQQWGFVPQRFADNPFSPEQVATMFTSMFMHGGWAHLLGNMWFLWIFGDNVEDRMGHLGFLVFYLLCGLSGDFCSLLWDGAQNVPNIGASGAIAGVMGAYLILYPNANVRMAMDEAWFLGWNWPAWAVIGEWAALQYFMGIVLHDTASHVGYYAHLGGLAAGIVLVFSFAHKADSAVRYDRYGTY